MLFRSALKGRNMVGVSATGSGKTLAFLLPGMIHINAQVSIVFIFKIFECGFLPFFFSFDHTVAETENIKPLRSSKDGNDCLKHWTNLIFKFYNPLEELHVLNRIKIRFVSFSVCGFLVHDFFSPHLLTRINYIKTGILFYYILGIV